MRIRECKQTPPKFSSLLVILSFCSCYCRHLLIKRDMGLRKFLQNGDTSFMYTDISLPEEILVLLLLGDTAYSVKLKTESEAVKKWCRNLQKNPQEYMTLLHKAVESSSSTNAEDESSQEDVFEIQEDCLVWKQYFPDKKVYGRRGKFTMMKISSDEALRQILNGTIGDLDAKSNQIQKLTDDLDKKCIELQGAKDLAAKSVQEKEAFEKEVYGKCVSLINSKKLRIKQLMSNRPTTSGEGNTAVRKIITSTPSTSQVSKVTKPSDCDSDGYSSNTDVDTDEENAQRTDTEKMRKKGDVKVKAKQRTAPAIDSQDDLFNNSLEAELYSTDTSKKRKFTTESFGASNNKLYGKNGNKKSVNGRTDCSEASADDPPLLNNIDGDSQRSILDDLF